MVVQNDKDFAALPEVAKLYQACKERDLTIAEREYLKGARDAWQAAKAQAVPEGFVLVPEDQAKDTDRLNFLLGGEKYIRTVIHRDIQNDEYEKIGEHFQLTEVFWIDGFDYWENTSSDSERGAIDKAMIEAQEPAND